MATFPNWAGRYTRLRRYIQLACLAIFSLLPLFDLCRFDFESNRLHLFRREIWLDEWALLWLALMFGMWLIGALSLILGRVYCAYACPQMVFTELAHDLDALGKRLARSFAVGLRRPAARAISTSLLALVSVGVSVLFMGYFAPLSRILTRLFHLDFGLWVGLIGASIAFLTFLDFAFVRESFCRAACPYGLLQGLLEDGRSLHVALDESRGPCIDCQACARICPMEIDIREGAFQIECTRCGSCIDECDRILARSKPPRPGVLAFRLPGFSFGSLDAKRLLVAFATLGFGAVLAFAVATREPLSFQLSPVYVESAAQQPTPVSESRFLLRAANRTAGPVTLVLRPEGLPAEAQVEGFEDPVVPAGAERRFEIVVKVPLAGKHRSVTPFIWVIEGDGMSKRFAAALLIREPKSA